MNRYLYRFLLIVTMLCMVGELTSCGTSGPLYLTPQYIQSHATPQQPIAPSKNLSKLPPGGSN